MKCYTYNALELNGRLANQLWQIAATICLAEQNSGIARFRSDWAYRDYFNVPDEFFSQYDKNEFEVIDGETAYFQNYYEYVKPIESKIREYFSPSLSAKRIVGNIWASEFYSFVSSFICVIHVRRGDYLKNPQHFPLPTERYYNTAIDLILDKTPNTKFIVFSDDIEWCENNTKYLGLHKIEEDRYKFRHGIETPVEVKDRIKPPEDWIDFFLMTDCDFWVIANSSFSWWGAFLGMEDTKPIYPNKWWGKKVEGHENWRELFPAEWRCVEC